MKEKKTKKLPMKKRIGQTAKKTGIGALSIVGGTATAAGVGSLAPFAGLIMLGAGYFLGGKWQLLTVAGAATLGYGIAKAQDNRLDEGVKERFVTFKNDWIHAFYVDKLINKGESDFDSSDTTIGAIDLSELDHFDEKLKESAIKFQMGQMEEDSAPAIEMDDEESEEIDFAIIAEDELDFNDF
jgi:hypothetical protein